MNAFLRILTAIVLLASMTTPLFAEEAATPPGEDASKSSWISNLEEAMAASQKENKPIFVDFTGSDW